MLLLCLRRVLLVQLLRVLPTGAESCTADPDQSLKVDPKVRSRSKDLAVCDSWSWRRCLVEKAFVRRPGFAGRRPALVGPRAPTMASRLLALAMLGSGKRSRCPCCPPSPAERSRGRLFSLINCDNDQHGPAKAGRRSAETALGRAAHLAAWFAWRSGRPNFPADGLESGDDRLRRDGASANTPAAARFNGHKSRAG